MHTHPQRFLPILLLCLTATTVHPQGVTFTNSFIADAFVRASVTASNYGGAGALEISGATATNAAGFTNGAFDSFMRFNTAGMVSNLNTTFGGTNWSITGVTLKVFEQPVPPQTNFNRGTGLFEIRWLANDGWTEGTGTPNAPTTDGITYNDEASLLSALNDLSLGSFANAGVTNLQAFSLGLPAGFVGDLRAGGDVSLFLTAISPGIGFNFNSRSVGIAALRPTIEITAVPEPHVAALAAGGSTLLLGWRLLRHWRRPLARRRLP